MAATGLYAGERWAGVMWAADDMPWIAIAAGCFGVLLIIESVRIFSAKKDTSLATLGDLKEWSVASNLELQSIRDAAEKLPMEPLGADGTELVRLPNNTNLVKLPDGSFRLALPVRLRASLDVVTLTESDDLKIVKGSGDD